MLIYPPQVLFLPEASDYIPFTAQDSLSTCLPALSSPFVMGLKSLAHKHGLSICVGIHEPTEDHKKVKNTLIWIDTSGSLVQRYQKLHLFDVDIKGGPVLHESDSVEPGRDLWDPFDTEIGKVGLQICFDMRFPEPGLALRHRGAQILTYPSAFTVPTGIAHWETLLRARAIETQSYVIAAAQCGRHSTSPYAPRRSYGHSMIVDPWGKVVAKLGGEGEEENPNLDIGEIAVADIDLALVDKVRAEMPLLRRTDVYPEIK